MIFCHEHIIQILQEARSYIARGWCAYAYARDTNCSPINPTTPDACCWDIRGALYKANHQLGFTYQTALYVTARRALRTSVQSELLEEWNDTPGRTQAEVLAAFDRAIEMEKGKVGA